MKLFYTILIAFFAVFISFTAHAQQSKLWGTTSSGGGEFGTIFSILKGGTAVNDQYNLPGIPGALPEYTTLIQGSDGKLYGMTYAGGTNNAGTIFQYDPSTGTYTRKINLAKATG